MSESEAKALAAEVEQHYPMLRVDGCGEFWHGKGWEIVATHRRRRNQFLVTNETLKRYASERV